MGKKSPKKKIELSGYVHIALLIEAGSHNGNCILIVKLYFTKCSKQQWYGTHLAVAMKVWNPPCCQMEDSHPNQDFYFFIFMEISFKETLGPN